MPVRGGLTRALETWFRKNSRDLPWRRRRDGYTALVAEAMLQQTQVARVLERYEAFLARFPDVGTLARADEQEVLAAWQGLGYYRRARHLHAAARVIVSDFGGRVPETVEHLGRLPGVGRYTAGAIASIVYGHAAPIVDGNVRRVLARLDADGAPSRDRATVRRAWARAEALAREASDPGVFNEALMELGATVCTPRAPRCDACPLAAECRARALGRQEKIPPANTATPRKTVHYHTLVIRRGDAVLFEQRPAGGLWARMWQTPTVEAARRLPAREIESRLPFAVTALARRAGFDHVTTHRRVRFHVFTAGTRRRRGVWRGPDELADLPMSNAQRKVLATLAAGAHGPCPCS